jgi:hypothetical protein
VLQPTRRRGEQCWQEASLGRLPSSLPRATLQPLTLTC